MAQIQNAGNRRGSDAYHNQFLDTSSILESTLRKGLSEKVGKVFASSDTDESVDQTLKNFGIKTGVDDKTIDLIESTKDALISLYQDFGASPVVSNKIEKIIRKIEDIQFAIGIEPEPFDPLKSRSGLEAGEQLENANKVVANTVNHYRLFPISSIKANFSSSGPSVDVNIFGESGDMGFEVTATVSAEEDFDGNEAIDYVYSQSGGLLSVKARSQGAWKDVSENFEINCSVKRYKLNDVPEDLHSLFLGEKIISGGQDKIVTALKINNEDVKFGKCRIFSKNREIVESIRNLVRVNKL